MTSATVPGARRADLWFPAECVRRFSQIGNPRVQNATWSALNHAALSLLEDFKFSSEATDRSRTQELELGTRWIRSGKRCNHLSLYGTHFFLAVSFIGGTVLAPPACIPIPTLLILCAARQTIQVQALVVVR